MFDEDNVIYNNQLPDDFFYEGSLFYSISEIKGQETLSFDLKLYSVENEHISTTCLVVDSYNGIVFMSPVSLSFYLGA